MTLQSLQHRHKGGWERFCLGWHDYQATIRLLNRERELTQLVRWAERKRLKGQHFHYSRLLNDTERALWRKRVQTPWAAAWAFSLYRLSCLVFPDEPHRKGCARKFRRRWASV